MLRPLVAAPYSLDSHGHGTTAAPTAAARNPSLRHVPFSAAVEPLLPVLARNPNLRPSAHRVGGGGREYTAVLRTIIDLYWRRDQEANAADAADNVQPPEWPAPLPRSLDASSLALLRRYPYRVLEKSDGFHYICWFGAVAGMPARCYFLNRALELFTVPLAQAPSPLFRGRGTLLEGEIVLVPQAIPAARRWTSRPSTTSAEAARGETKANADGTPPPGFARRFLVFEALRVADVDLRGAPFSQRLATARRYCHGRALQPTGDLSWEVKRDFPAQQAEQVWNGARKKLRHVSEGLVFVPEAPWYAKCAAASRTVPFGGNDVDNGTGPDDDSGAAPSVAPSRRHRPELKWKHWHTVDLELAVQRQAEGHLSTKWMYLCGRHRVDARISFYYRGAPVFVEILRSPMLKTLLDAARTALTTPGDYTTVVIECRVACTALTEADLRTMPPRRRVERLAPRHVNLGGLLPFRDTEDKTFRLPPWKYKMTLDVLKPRGDKTDPNHLVTAVSSLLSSSVSLADVARTVGVRTAETCG